MWKKSVREKAFQQEGTALLWSAFFVVKKGKVS